MSMMKWLIDAVRSVLVNDAKRYKSMRKFMDDLMDDLEDGTSKDCKYHEARYYVLKLGDNISGNTPPNILAYILSRVAKDPSVVLIQFRNHADYQEFMRTHPKSSSIYGDDGLNLVALSGMYHDWLIKRLIYSAMYFKYEEEED